MGNLEKLPLNAYIQPMIYLVLSFLAFLFAMFGIVFFAKNFYSTDSHRGKLADLDFILKFLSTTDIEEAELKISVMRRVTWMDVVMTEQGMSVELPLITKQQISRKTKYVTICEKLGATVQIKQNDEGLSLLVFGYTGEPDELSIALKDCLVQIFDITEDRKLEFAIRAKRMDHLYLVKKFDPETKEKLDAVALSSLLVDPKVERNSFILTRMAAIIFLRPVVFMTGFLFGGFVGFCIALLIWVVLIAIFDKLYISSKWLGFDDIKILLQIGLIGLALWSLSQFYVQVQPSILAVVMIFQNSLALLFGTTHWPVFPVLDSIKKRYDAKGRFGFIALSLAIFFGNEYLRSTVSFETWAWVVSFGPLGLIIVGFTLSIFAITIAGALGYLDEKETS